jgi:TonB family protein
MRNEKILVVEFEENSLNSLLQILQTEGFQVVTAKDGHEGLLMFESENPDLVILEPMLLKLHGFDLCRKITKDSRKRTPVIITTGFYKGDHYKSEAIETFGAAAFFEKPYENEDLLTTIHNLLGNGTGEAVEEVKKSVREKKTAAIDIEESVREMERSIKEEEKKRKDQQQKAVSATEKTGKSEIKSEIDNMLQSALSDFGLSIDKKSTKKVEEKAQKKVEMKIEEEAPVVKQKAVAEKKSKVSEEVRQVEKQEEEDELKTEELIEELIQKEEQIEEEETPEFEVVEQEAEEKADIPEKQAEKEGKIEESEANQKIFEEYFEEPEKPPVGRNLFGFLKRIKKPLPLMIGSTAFVVLVAAGATYYFLKPNKPKAVANQKSSQTISDVERSTPDLEQKESLTSSSQTQNDGAQSESLGGPTLEGAQRNPSENTTPNDIATKPAEPVSTTEFMATTSLSSRQRQVMLPEGTASPETRKFEIIEVEEAGEEELEDSKVEISTPLLQEAAKSVIQTEDAADRIKTGDLVPIDSVDVPPVATKKINPKYPPAAYQRGIEETVVFRALISEFGNVLDVVFVDSDKTAPAFRKSCDEAIRQWRFSPAKKNGVNVKVWKTFSIAFKKNKTE